MTRFVSLRDNPDDDEEEEADSEKEDEQGEGSGGKAKLGITTENALHNYSWAGTPVEETLPSVDPDRYAHLVRPGVREKLDSILEETPELPYQPTDVQMLGASLLGSGHDLFLVFPTGEGKMTVGLLGALLMRRIKQQPRGVAILTQPLTREYQWSILHLKMCQHLQKSSGLTDSPI